MEIRIEPGDYIILPKTSGCYLQAFNQFNIENNSFHFDK